MRLEKRVFWSILVPALVSTAATAYFGLTLVSRVESAADSPKAEAAFSDAETLSARGDATAQDMADAIAPARREYVRMRLLRDDAIFEAGAALVVLVALEILVAVGVSFAATRWASAGWRNVYRGLASVERGDGAYRFREGADEFGRLGGRLNELVRVLEERKRVAREMDGLRGWGEAASFLAHQSRTPLASISLSARTAREALERRPDSSEGDLGLALESVGRAESESRRLASIISRLRSLSDFGELSLEALDPADALSSAAVSVRARYARADPARIAVTRSGEGPLPLFDRRYLEQAFVNLLANSYEAGAFDGDDAAAVTVDFARSAETFRVSYEDAVRDVAPDLAERVGERRFTTKPEGTGLGVWLVGRIASLHGGSLSVGRAGRGGLAFALEFPVDPKGS